MGLVEPNKPSVAYRIDTADYLCRLPPVDDPMRPVAGVSASLSEGHIESVQLVDRAAAAMWSATTSMPQTDVADYLLPSEFRRCGHSR